MNKKKFFLKILPRVVIILVGVTLLYVAVAAYMIGMAFGPGTRLEYIKEILPIVLSAILIIVFNNFYRKISRVVLISLLLIYILFIIFNIN